MEPIRLSNLEAIIYFALLNATIGFVLGLIPLCFGYFKGRKKLGILGIFSSTLGGAVFGIYFSFPLVAIFMWLIIEKKLARIGISAFVTVVGICLAVVAYVRSTTGSTDGLEIAGAQDPIFLALMIGGVIFTLVGVLLLVLSLLPRSEKNEESSVDSLSVE